MEDELTKEQATKKLRAVGPEVIEPTEQIEETNLETEVTEDLNEEQTLPETEVVEDTDAGEQTEDTDDQIELDAEQLSKILGVEASDVIIDDSGKLAIRTNVDGEEGNLRKDLEIARDYFAPVELMYEVMTHKVKSFDEMNLPRTDEAFEADRKSGV